MHFNLNLEKLEIKNQKKREVQLEMKRDEKLVFR